MLNIKKSKILHEHILEQAIMLLAEGRDVESVEHLSAEERILIKMVIERI